MNKTLGLVLVVIGLAALVWGGFSHSAGVMGGRMSGGSSGSMGAIHDTGDGYGRWPLIPIAGAIAVLGGIVVLTVTRKSNA